MLSIDAIFPTGFKISIAIVYQYTLSHRTRTSNTSQNKYRGIMNKIIHWIDKSKSQNMACILMGDFNAVIDPSQRSGQQNSSDLQWQRIKTTIMQNTYVLLKGQEWDPTWTSKVDQEWQARLDAILVDRQLALTLQSYQSQDIEGTTSDHKRVEISLNIKEAKWWSSNHTRIDWKLSSSKKRKFIEELGDKC